MSFVFLGGRASVSCSTTSTKKSKICVSANRFSTEHVGGGYFVSITTGCEFVDIRKFHMAEGQMQEEPSDAGIQLALAEWDKIPGTIELAKAVFHGLQLQAKTCFDINHRSDPHHAQPCSECSPFCSMSSHMEHSLVEMLQNTTTSDSA